MSTVAAEDRVGPLSGRERLLRTLRGDPVDRMPIAPFLYYNAVYEMFDYKPDIYHFYDPPDFDVVEKFEGLSLVPLSLPSRRIVPSKVLPPSNST